MIKLTKKYNAHLREPCQIPDLGMDFPMAALETLQNVLNVPGCIASQDENSSLAGEEMTAPVEKYTADPLQTS